MLNDSFGAGIEPESTPNETTALADALDARFAASEANGRMMAALPSFDFSKVEGLAQELLPIVKKYYDSVQVILPANITDAVSKTTTAVTATTEAVAAIINVVHPAV